MTYKIGITGGIASGKTTAANYLRQQKYQVIDTDEIARQVVEAGSPGLEKIKKIFGLDYIQSDGSLNRSKLGELVFNDPVKLRQLNEITHPLIFQELDKQLAAIKDSLVFVELALLYELKKADEFDEVWVVYADETTQIKRLKERNGLNKSQAEARIKSQLPTEDKVKAADRIISSQTSREAMFKEIDEALQKVLNTL